MSYDFENNFTGIDHLGARRPLLSESELDLPLQKYSFLNDSKKRIFSCRVVPEKWMALLFSNSMLKRSTWNASVEWFVNPIIVYSVIMEAGSASVLKIK